MKKSCAGILILSILLSLASCSGKKNVDCAHCGKSILETANFCEHCGVNVNINNEADNSSGAPETQNLDAGSVNEENLLDVLQGHWAQAHIGFCDGISFNQNEVTAWTYPGEYGRTGTITNIKQRNGEFEITVYYPEIEYMGDYYPEYESKSYISSSDNYKNIINFNQIELLFLGKPEDEVAEKCDELIAKENGDYQNTNTLTTIPVSMDIIGSSFKLACKKADSSPLEVHTDNIRDFCISLKDNQRLFAFLGDVYEYYIVENDVVVGYMFRPRDVSSNLTMKQYFPSDDCYSVDPQIAYVNGFGFCCWKTTNCYVIFGAIGIDQATDTSDYHNWPTTTYALIEDITQFDYSTQYN